MRLLVLGQLAPRARHGPRAANIVMFELLAALATKQGTRVGFLKIKLEDGPVDEVFEPEEIVQLENNGVQVLPELLIPRPVRRRSAFAKLVSPMVTDFYPWAAHGALLEDSIKTFQPDVIFIPWDEQVTAFCSDFENVLKFAYYGNPDHKAGVHRAAFDRRHRINKHSRLRTSLYLKRLEQVHIKIIKRYEILGDVAANDAEYYERAGHPNAFYIRNVWVDRFGTRWRELRRQLEAHTPVVIVANVGNLGGTANRYGLEILAHEVSPILSDMLPKGSYELHVLGGGELLPSLAGALSRQGVKVRGFVDDIDGELFRSAVFLCLNNGSPYKVGHTRYLHAWSLGCCVVAHTDARLSMPEIVDRENALLGRSSSEIAERVREAVTNESLRRRLGEAGYETFSRYFRAAAVADDIVGRIRAATATTARV